MSEAKHLQRLPEKALDALYDSLSVQTMPDGRYDGRAWIYGHPVLGWLASLVWRGKVFTAPPSAQQSYCSLAQNRILGLLMFRGFVSAAVWKRELKRDEAAIVDWYEVLINYSRFGLTDTVRQVSPTLYLGRMQWRRWTVHFTLVKE